MALISLPAAHKENLVWLYHAHTETHTAISIQELTVTELSHYYCTYPVITRPLGMAVPAPCLTSGVNSTPLTTLSDIITHTRYLLSAAHWGLYCPRVFGFYLLPQRGKKEREEGRGRGRREEEKQQHLSKFVTYARALTHN